ncbi:MAG: hypothetical protein KC619_19470 [Myxococcales bacterium]|nr:hypothetical protein [Myxococcales bacterium]
MHVEPRHALKESPLEPDGERDADVDDEAGDRGEEPRIRCPRCRWVPRRGDAWMCYCGCEFHTFETAGRCPDCGFQYRETMCLACERWSPHLAWYTDPPR